MPKGSHRPKKEDEFKPDWDLIKELVASQCTKEEVAARFDVNPKTIATHIENEFGIGWKEFRNRYKLVGFASLRAKTYEKAIKDGDWQAIRHLRRHWFDEHDKNEVGFDPEKPAKFVLNMGKKLSEEETHDDEDNQDTED